MRKHRLLKIRRHETGSAALESIFAIVFLVFLVLGVVQVSFVLYARNVVAASAHEGARAAMELGRDAGESEAIALRTVERAAGGLLRGLRVQTSVIEADLTAQISVRVSGSVKPFGPVPIAIPVSTTAHVTKVMAVP
jgi:Flp pilus assembly protein TadG